MKFLANGSKPLWSPHGERLLFYRNDIRVINQDGTGEAKITYGPFRSNYAWTPSGNLLLFWPDNYARDIDLEAGIYRYGIDKHLLRSYRGDLYQDKELLDCVLIVRNCNGIACAPNGKFIAIIALLNEDYENHIYLLDNKGTITKRFPHFPVRGSISWSPDSNKIAFGGSNGRLNIIDINSGSHHKWEDILVKSTSWAPNGQEIVCASDMPGAFTLLNLVSNNIQQILISEEQAKIKSVAWSPNGEYWAIDYKNEISFVRYRSLNS